MYTQPDDSCYLKYVPPPSINLERDSLCIFYQYVQHSSLQSTAYGTEVLINTLEVNL